VKTVIFILVLSLLTGLTAAPAPAARGSKSLFVYCAAGMRKPIEALTSEFEKDKSVKVDLTYDGSNKLLGQIKLTRKGDVYIAGDADYIEMAKKDALAGDAKPVCWFVPVIMVKKANPKGIKTLSDCVKPGIKIGQGDDKAAAVGRLMPQLLELNNVDSVAWRKNVAVVTPTVNELGLAMKLGTIDAAVVWSAIANNYADVADQVALPPEKNLTPEVGAAVLAFTKEPALAKAYLEYLVSDKAKKVLKDNGYAIEKPVK
jgi:molybdate transport system substrate-binding protein